jgi:hypothetical protein
MVLSSAIAADFGVIKGRIVDKKTAEPLSLVNVILKGSTRGAATDEDGRYLVPKVPTGRYRVMASMIGYKTVSKMVVVSANEVSIVNFELHQTAILMGDIIVTATKTENILGDIPMSADVITKEEIELANIETASQAVKYTTGVYAQGGFGWVKEAAKLQGLNHNTPYFF